MWIDRQIIENRILDILTYIEKNTLAFPLKENIKLFPLKELEQILEFLESWNLSYIYTLLDAKLKEYIWLIEELKMIQIWKKKKEKLSEEFEEQKIEEQELEQLINF